MSTNACGTATKYFSEVISLKIPLLCQLTTVISCDYKYGCDFSKYAFFSNKEQWHFFDETQCSYFLRVFIFNMFLFYSYFLFMFFLLPWCSGYHYRLTGGVWEFTVMKIFDNDAHGIFTAGWAHSRKKRKKKTKDFTKLENIKKVWKPHRLIA